MEVELHTLTSALHRNQWPLSDIRNFNPEGPPLHGYTLGKRLGGKQIQSRCGDKGENP